MQSLIKDNTFSSFVTSDHHFGSCHSWLKRTTLEEDEQHIKIWNEVIGADDLVYYVGDFLDVQGADLSVRPGAVAELIALRARLNGCIVLIRGNHDRLDDLLGNPVYQSVFDDVVSELVLPEHNLKLIHEPNPARMIPGGLTIYGHEHEPSDEFPTVTDSTFCCCAMRHEWKPVRLSDALQAMREKAAR